jgi:flagellin-specific chaperone FliS
MFYYDLLPLLVSLLHFFEEKLNEINWNEKLDHLNDVDEMLEKFTKCFLKIAQECIPTKI